ncbi:MAG: PPC domain-containing protein [Planctomycetia bacterium]|nr:PPC domain-containing protein [Planctomycetia bacterium]
MRSIRQGLVAFLAVGAVCAALFAAGCRPHRDHDDDDDHHHDDDDDVDLEDDGGHYSDDTAIPGYHFDMGGDVRNDGDDWSGSFVVRFYASENSTISSSDYFLGSDWLGSIAPGSWASADLSVSFPHSVPPGRYYVGWIIDADDDVDETDEGDNVVVRSGPSLLVEDEYEPNDEDWSAYHLGGPDTLYLIEAVISEDGDEDWFSFWQDDGFAINITLHSLPDDYELELYDDGGGLIASSSNGGLTTEFISEVATYTGYYYIRVQGWGAAHDEDDEYWLDVDLE